MGKATVTRDDLAILAGRVGLVANDDAGRETFKAAFAANPKQVRARLFQKVDASRAQASARAAAAAGTGSASAGQQYPGGWLRAAGVRLGRAPRAATPQPAPAPVAAAEVAAPEAGPTKYPANWHIPPVSTDGTTYDVKD